MPPIIRTPDRTVHFRRAATRLHMTQPPLTVAIRQLEDLVGTSLLERSRHGAKLTAAGQRFLDEARYLLAQAARAVAAARRGPEVSPACSGTFANFARDRFRRPCSLRWATLKRSS